MNVRAASRVAASSWAPVVSPQPALSVSVVVVTYNAADTIAACLDALPGALHGTSYELLVVDNASTDATITVMRDHPSAPRILASPRNEGFSCGNNRAIRRATGRWVLLLNPDTVCPPRSLQELLAAVDDDETIGVAAPRVVNPDGSDQGTARRFPGAAAAVFGRRSPITRRWPQNRWSRRFRVDLDPALLVHEVDWVSGACLLVRRGLLEEIGTLDPGYFLYWEDADLCRRVHDAGRRVVVVPSTAIVHDEGVARVGWPLRRIIHFHASAYRYQASHHLRGGAMVLRPLAATALASRALACAALGLASRLRASLGGRL